MLTPVAKGVKDHRRLDSLGNTKFEGVMILFIGVVMFETSGIR